jgi:hypothetical protein
MTTKRRKLPTPVTSTTDEDLVDAAIVGWARYGNERTAHLIEQLDSRAATPRRHDAVLRQGLQNCLTQYHVVLDALRPPGEPT